MLTEHCGDQMLLAKVIQVKPKYHLFGHIHEGYGVLKTNDKQPYGNCTFINASCVNSAYGMQNKPIVMEI